MPWFPPGPTGVNQGITYVFRDTGTGWVQESRVLAPEPGAEHVFGSAAATDGTRLAVGATGTAQSGPGTGSAYVYEVLDPGCPTGLVTGAPGFSVALGGSVGFFLNAGSARAGGVYLVLGSLSGTSPGFVLDGLTIPLNPDAYLVISATAAGTAPFVDTVGVLGALGTGNAAFAAPPGLPASLVGTVVHHAFLTVALAGGIPTVAFASEAEALTLFP